MTTQTKPQAAALAELIDAVIASESLYQGQSYVINAGTRKTAKAAKREYTALVAVADDMSRALPMLEAVVSSRAHLPPSQRNRLIESFKDDLAKLEAVRKDGGK